MRTNHKSFLSVLIVLVMLAAALTPVATARSAPAPQELTLKMGLLPILDVLPFYVAQEEGYFADEGVNIELVPVSSALERDQLLLAGGIDGMLNDLISTGIFNQDEPMIKIVAQARRAYEDAPQFRILAAPDSGITTPEDLKGVEIAISENSVIHYITQRILENAGLTDDEMSFRTEPNIPVRFQLLMEGQIQAACLPDPLGQAAMNGGAILVADDTALVDTQFSQSVLSFRTEIVDNNPDAVTAFLKAWMHAADDINDNPEAYRELWIENTNVPDSVKDSYQLPPFPTYDITDEFAWDYAMNWMVDQGIIDSAPSYEDSVDSSFIDQIKPEDMGGETAAQGDPVHGEEVFNTVGCAGCHSLEEGVTIVGPSLSDAGTDAGEMVPGMSAADYLRQSILEPDAVIVEGFNNLMPSYEGQLSDSDLNDLIAYLLTLE